MTRLIAYRVLKRLGQGTRKVVDLATYQGQEFAAAALKPDCKPEDVIAEFEAIVRLLLAPHRYRDLLPAHHAIVFDQGCCIIFREALQTSLDAFAPLRDERRWLEIARDLSCGLVRIHDAGLVHRDIKLENCGVAASKRAKFLDLGSIANPRANTTILTRAPEVLAGGEASPASDVWALGATLWALRSGRYPFVTRQKLHWKNRLDAAHLAGRLDGAKWRAARSRLEQSIVAQSASADAELLLRRRVARAFAPKLSAPLSAMLSFDPRKRPTASVLVGMWQRALHALTRTDARAART